MLRRPLRSFNTFMVRVGVRDRVRGMVPAGIVWPDWFRKRRS